MQGNYKSRDMFNPYLMNEKEVRYLISRLQSRRKNTERSILMGCKPQLTIKMVLHDCFERLGELAEQKGVSAEELAKMLGVDLNSADNKLPIVEKYNKININERSYVWLGYNVQKQLNTLFVKFKEELNLIEEKTNFIDFARVFMGTELNHIKNIINWKGPLRALIYFITRACHREHLEIESNLRWKQLAATFYFNGHELKKEEFEKEFFKLSNTEHIPSVGPEIDLIFRSFI